jgi:hypothetical protein
VRGFAATENYLQKYRLRCNAAMLNNIIARVESYTSEMHRKKIQNYVTLNDALKNAGIFVPGCAFNSSQRSFWQLPLLVSNKLQFREFA